MGEFVVIEKCLLSELAESLAAELDARYPACNRSYPRNERRYQSEMEPVTKAREILEAQKPEAEPVGYLFFKSGCRAPDDCEDYEEYISLEDVNPDELAKYQKHDRVMPLYTHPPAQGQPANPAHEPITVAKSKIKSLVSEGLSVIGTLIEGNGKRAIVSNFGKVTWEQEQPEGGE